MQNFNNFHKNGGRGGRRDFRRQTHHHSMDGNRRNTESEDIYQLLPARRQNRRGRNGDSLRSHLGGRYLPHSEAGYYQTSGILQEPHYYYDEGFGCPIGPDTFRYILNEYRPQSQIAVRDHSSQRRLFPNGIQFTQISYNVLGPNNNNPTSYSNTLHGYPNLTTNLPSYYQEPCMSPNHSSVTAEIPSCICQSTPYFLVIESGEPPYIGIPIPPEDVRFYPFSPGSPPADPDLMDD